VTGDEAIKVVETMREVASIELAKFEPDDIIVIECEGRLSGNSIDRITEMTKEIFGDRRVVVLDGGMKLKIARA
jgi:hypothetical protein